MKQSDFDFKRLIEQHAKPFFFVAIFLFAACAQAATTTVTNQPPSHAGWEASQDVRLPVRESNSRIFRAAITFTSTASNNVQMASGKDVDGDGKLPAEETSRQSDGIAAHGLSFQPTSSISLPASRQMPQPRPAGRSE